VTCEEEPALLQQLYFVKEKYAIAKIFMINGKTSSIKECQPN